MELLHTHAEVAVVLVERHKVHGGRGFSCDPDQDAQSLEMANEAWACRSWVTAARPSTSDVLCYPTKVFVLCEDGDMCTCAWSREHGDALVEVGVRLVMRVRLMNS
jgi:hypothetical protein